MGSAFGITPTDQSIDFPRLYLFHWRRLNRWSFKPVSKLFLQSISFLSLVNCLFSLTFRLARWSTFRRSTIIILSHFLSLSTIFFQKNSNKKTVTHFWVTVDILSSVMYTKYQRPPFLVKVVLYQSRLMSCLQTTCIHKYISATLRNLTFFCRFFRSTQF